MHNADFKFVEFNRLLYEARASTFTLSPQVGWLYKNAIDISITSGQKYIESSS